MSARSLRRAAERKAKNLDRTTGLADSRFSSPVVGNPNPIAAGNDSPLSATAAAPALDALPPEIAPEPISPARLMANRDNALKSTGPKSPEGKTISSLNAVKTALTGRTVLLPSDDAAEYQRHTLAYEKDFKPVGQRERDLVYSIADNVWRLQRVRCLEQAFFSKGRIEFAEMFPKAEPAIRLSLIELHTFEVYEKKLRNLSLQEARLARRREREIVELRLLQSERKESQQKDLKTAATLYQAAKLHGQTFNPAELGFEFSINDIEAFSKRHGPPSTHNFSAAQPNAHLPAE